jgi:putative membrane protein
VSAGPAGAPAAGQHPAEETQPERTALAWQRTGLGVLAVGGLLAHAALTTGRLSLVVLAGAVALLALAVLGGLAPLRYRQVRRTVASDAGASVGRPVAAVAGVVLLVGAAAVAAVLVILLHR